eukprot:jgi/Pico_ML_1/51294/g2351.t1
MTVLMLAILVAVNASPINITASRNVNMFDEELKMVLEVTLVDSRDALKFFACPFYTFVPFSWRLLSSFPSSDQPVHGKVHHEEMGVEMQVRGTVNTKMLLAGWGPIGIDVANADAEYYLSTSEEVEGITGKYFVNNHESRASPFAYDTEIRTSMWSLWEKQTGAADPGKKDAMAIAVGLERGHQVTKRDKKDRVARRKGALGKRTKFVRDIVREVAGLAPYEKRICELLKVGKDKRALKVAKKKYFLFQHICKAPRTGSTTDQDDVRKEFLLQVYACAAKDAFHYGHV